MSKFQKMLNSAVIQGEDQIVVNTIPDSDKLELIENGFEVIEKENYIIIRK